jgi:DNA polymerase beta
MDHKSTILSTLETLRLHELRSTESNAKFKAIAYQKAIVSIRGFYGPIRSLEDITGLKGIGPKITAKLAELIETGRLAAAERIHAVAPDTRALDTLLKIHGVGRVKANELLELGIHDIASLRLRLRTEPGLLNATQKIGLNYYEDGCLRIPRGEMEAHNHRVFLAVHRDSPVLTWTIAGSYRRGAETSGDIDVLLSYDDHYDEDDAQDAFQDVITTMERDGYIVDTLAKGTKKWMGYVRLRPDLPARRMDMLLTDPETYPFAILYFTGSDKFNMAMRGYCHTRGYTLNESRIAAREPGRPVPPRMKTEMDIFRFLGLHYIPPPERVDEGQIRPLDSP